MPPIPAALIPGLIAAGGQQFGQGINAALQGSMNRKTRQWNEKMYGLQRQHALEDWNRQNEYNNPMNTMARFKAAGLNPHLIYGGGVGNQAGPIRSTDVKGWNPTTPQFDLGEVARSALFTGVDLETKQTQLDRIQAAIAVDKQRALNIAQDTSLKVQNTAKTKWQTEQAQRLGVYSLEAARLGVRQIEENTLRTKTSTQLLGEQIATEQVMRPLRAAESRAKIGNIIQNTAVGSAQERQIKQNITNQQWKAQIDSLAVELNSFMNDERKAGKNPNESAFGRLLFEAYHKSTEGIKTMRREMKEKGFWKWLFDNGEYKDYYKY